VLHKLYIEPIDDPDKRAEIEQFVRPPPSTRRCCRTSRPRRVGRDYRLRHLRWRRSPKRHLRDCDCGRAWPKV